MHMGNMYSLIGALTHVMGMKHPPRKRSTFTFLSVYC